MLHPSPARVVPGFHLPPMATVVVPPLRRRVKGAVAGALLGLIPASAVMMHCRCWQGFGLTGLGALAGYGIGRLLERPLRARPAPAPATLERTPRGAGSVAAEADAAANQLGHEAEP